MSKVFPKPMPKCLKYQRVSKSAQECPSLAWVLPFIGSDLFILTSMVMPSITMEVIHMYVSIAMKLSKYLTGHLCIVYQQLIKVNTNSFMCDTVLPQGIRVHLEFISNAVLVLQWHADHDSGMLVGQTGAPVV